jgi:hypothetical protein
VHGEDAGDVPYPSGTSDLHHEVALVVALGRDADGVVDPAHALDLVFGLFVGLGMLMFAAIRRMVRGKPAVAAAAPQVIEGEYSVVGRAPVTLPMH